MLYSSTAPPPEVLSAIMVSGCITLDLYSRVMSSLGLPPGILRVQLGAHYYHDDIVFLPWSRPLLLPMLLAVLDLPSSYMWGSITGHALAPELYLEVLQLLLLSIAVQLALPGFIRSEEQFHYCDCM